MKKILVIEDEKAVLENIMEILEEQDYEIFGAPNGIEGAKKAKEHIPDLIICDVMMPELDGFGVLKLLQQNPSTSAIPFIFLTAKADKNDIRVGMEAGADDYLTKPFSPDQLYKAIDSRFKKNEIVRTASDKKLKDLRQNLTYALPHEFRTPLNGILSSSQFLKDYWKNLEEEDITVLFDNIHTSAQRLHHLILNYLFYSELEIISRDDLEIAKLQSFKTSNPKDIIQSVVEKVFSDSERIQDLYMELVDSEIMFMQDHFVHLVEEIIENAVKFSELNNPIKITTKIEDNQYHLEIKDFGRGMTNDQIANIGAYMQFQRRKYEQQGAGLGLTIAKKLCKFYNCSFEIKSTYGEYTCVNISFNLAY